MAHVVTCSHHSASVCCFLALLCCPPLLVLVVVLLLFVSEFSPQVIRLARCGHRVLGGARMVDVSMVAFPAALVSLSCLLLPLLVKPLRCCFLAL